MSKCPFWSSKKEKVNCYTECPMYPVSKNDEICPFVEHLTGNKIVLSEFDSDYSYSQENVYDLSFVGIKKYD